MPKDKSTGKVKVNVIEEGKKGVKLQLKAGDRDFVDFACMLDYKSNDEELVADLRKEAAVTEEMLDGMDVDLADNGSIMRYLGVCQERIMAIMHVLNVHANK